MKVAGNLLLSCSLLSLASALRDPWSVYKSTTTTPRSSVNSAKFNSARLPSIGLPPQKSWPAKYAEPVTRPHKHHKHQHHNYYGEEVNNPWQEVPNPWKQLNDLPPIKPKVPLDPLFRHQVPTQKPKVKSPVSDTRAPGDHETTHSLQASTKTKKKDKQRTEIVSKNKTKLDTTLSTLGVLNLQLEKQRQTTTEKTIKTSKKSRNKSSPTPSFLDTPAPQIPTQSSSKKQKQTHIVPKQPHLEGNPVPTQTVQLDTDQSSSNKKQNTYDNGIGTPLLDTTMKFYPKPPDLEKIRQEIEQSHYNQVEKFKSQIQAQLAREVKSQISNLPGTFPILNFAIHSTVSPHVLQRPYTNSAPAREQTFSNSALPFIEHEISESIPWHSQKNTQNNKPSPQLQNMKHTQNTAIQYPHIASEITLNVPNLPGGNFNMGQLHSQISQYGGAALSPQINQYGGPALSPHINQYGGSALSPQINQYGGSAFSSQINQYGGASSNPQINQYGGSALSPQINQYGGSALSSQINQYGGSALNPQINHGNGLHSQYGGPQINPYSGSVINQPFINPQQMSNLNTGYKSQLNSNFHPNFQQQQQQFQTQINPQSTFLQSQQISPNFQIGHQNTFSSPNIKINNQPNLHSIALQENNFNNVLKTKSKPHKDQHLESINPFKDDHADITKEWFQSHKPLNDPQKMVISFNSKRNPLKEFEHSESIPNWPQISAKPTKKPFNNDFKLTNTFKDTFITPQKTGKRKPYSQQLYTEAITQKPYYQQLYTEAITQKPFVSSNKYKVPENTEIIPQVPLHEQGIQNTEASRPLRAVYEAVGAKKKNKKRRPALDFKEKRKQTFIGGASHGFIDDVQDQKEYEHNQGFGDYLSHAEVLGTHTQGFSEHGTSYGDQSSTVLSHGGQGFQDHKPEPSLGFDDHRAEHSFDHHFDPHHGFGHEHVKPDLGHIKHEHNKFKGSNIDHHHALIVDTHIKQWGHLKEKIKKCKEKFQELELKKINHKFYYIGTDRLSWHSAQQFCYKHGLQLASVESHQENELLTAALRKVDPHAYFWLGGNDESFKGKWKWSGTGKDLSFTAWFHGEPNNIHQDEHCLDIFPKRSGKFNWSDFSCSFELKFVCELEHDECDVDHILD